MFYLQVTRGVAKRDHVFPAKSRALLTGGHRKEHRPGGGQRKAEKGISVITVPENRWDRVDIKTVGLLPNVMARQKAKEAGRSGSLVRR